MDCFALLDDATADDRHRRSRLYTGFAGELVCASARDLPHVLQAMQQALQAGRHALGLFSYELGADMLGIAARANISVPPARILLFDGCRRLCSTEAMQWLDEEAGQGPAGILAAKESVDEAQFAQAIARIRAYIEAGDTYQVNYTYRLRFDAYGAPLALYRRLRQRQPVPYGAFIALPDGGAVLSLSPELFIAHEEGRLTARPMKGTAPASGDAAADAARAEALAADAKNRAENLMIVDLLRNDVGRVAVTGSVRVPHLFKVEHYRSVLQMTSTIQAELRSDATLQDVFAALYPCGSITGAPKRRTMQIIRELEPDARGWYTGSLGWFDAAPSPRRSGDFCLSVPIRTLTLSPPKQDGLRRGELGIGAGIVHDSDALTELAECRLKAAFLTQLGDEFELIETIHAQRGEGCRHLALHLGRLAQSAACFGFRFDRNAVQARLQQACAELPDDRPHRLRLALSAQGAVSLQSAPLTPLAAPVKVMLAKAPVDLPPLFLRHKTTVRAPYDAAWREAEAHGAFDQLFFNTRGELTEGGRSNLFLKLDGRWYTPPLQAGLLPGVMRQALLADPAWAARERTLTLEDLRRAERIVVCNALRGALDAMLIDAR
ncbi:para-aminobenzoate synthetase / 4-amino-4-deoxychorismate lyase [Noviherbaspirillum humi]|uniref:Para-aminobenzoate synthetase / 4-amino-4-deoxychorismate lyase n=1 Tax=Noviherbaspirillum humi TaxID=1688639 RepID=A0A239IRS9_9BURK|nr:aminodeoxychorismate synthase component I [Noviherbaspirillum humi]SNS96245.1 para-aminobenzoate synthetase / 4-amino-4-deoxychorismate lyase [Noviherbaspirillum humi]